MTSRFRYANKSLARKLIIIGAFFLCCIYIPLNKLLGQSGEVSYVNLQSNKHGVLLHDCLKKASRGVPDSVCVHLVKSYLRSSRSLKAPVHTTTPVTSTTDCYSDLDVSSDKPHPFPNITDMRLHYLESFRQCGHTPRLMSHVHARADNLSLPVPNVVHFIWTNKADSKPDPMGFLQYMAVLSASKFIKPLYILWHGNNPPFGAWWNRTVAEVPNLYYVEWEMPETINGKELVRPAFKSDVLRLWVLIVHGGMYFDLDVIVLKSFDPLRVHRAVEGRELRFTLANGIMLSAPDAFFLKMALYAYRNFGFYQNVRASMILPNAIHRLFPGHLHVEDKSLLFPTWPNIEKLYTEPYDWSENYCVHIFGEKTYKHFLPHSKEDMDKLNNTLGQILKHVYYEEPAD